MYLPADDPRLIPIALRKELIETGFHNDRSLARALRRGDLARPRRGAYVDGVAWGRLSRQEQYAVRCRAAFRQAQTGVVLSHASALPFLDAPLWGFSLGEVHLTRDDALTGRREAGIRRHCGVLASGDVVDLDGLRVTSPLRATLETAVLGSTEAALVVANHFLHRGDFTLEELQGRYEDGMVRWPHSLPAEVVMRLANPLIESVGESRTWYAFYARSLPRPIPQYEVWDGDRLVGRVDFALPELGIWLEFDGRVKYERYRRPGESAADAVVREKLREQEIAELTGWRCLRITWADLADPVRLERRIRRLIDSVAAARRRSAS